MAASFTSTVLSPSLRVRLHNRNRLPELALAMSVATVVALFGASNFASANSDENGSRTNVEAAPIVEMRSVAAPAAPLMERRDVRVIPLDRARQ